MRELIVAGLWEQIDGGAKTFRAIRDYPTPFGCSDATSTQRDGDILNGIDVAVTRITLSDAQAAALEADPNYVVLPKNASALTPAELTTLRTRITALYHADVAYIVTRDSAAPDAIAAALVNASQRPVWRSGLAVTVGQVYQYQRNVYEVVQAHRTQSDWTPTVARSLWTRYRDPNAAAEAWIQPIGAHDAYRIGEKVTFGGFTWQNTIAANVWQPGVTGWTNLTPPPPVSAWAFPVAYKIGDEVTYQGNTYRCRQAHTSQAAWTPTAVAALWLRI